jgi:hypothetical protein
VRLWHAVVHVLDVRDSFVRFILLVSASILANVKIAMHCTFGFCLARFRPVYLSGGVGGSRLGLDPVEWVRGRGTERSPLRPEAGTPRRQAWCLGWEDGWC